MEVKQTGNTQKGMFYLEENNIKQAYMSYTLIGDSKFSIDHTVVNPGNEGKGLGKQLLTAAVDFARTNNYKIIPVCPYAKSVFDKTKAFDDVVLKN